MVDINELNLKNKESLQLCQEFLSTCTDADLSTAMPAGWTVSAVLAHLAVWDKRALILLEKWQKEGVEFSPNDIEVLNEVTKPFCLAIPPQAAKALFIQTAETVDKLISGYDSSMVDEIHEKGKNVHLNRAKHRLLHLDEIKAVLGKV
jgi:hypothetical protein